LEYNGEPEVSGVALDVNAEEFWNGRDFVRHCEVYGAVSNFGQSLGTLFASRVVREVTYLST
jgi:hypothetical protein